MHTYYPVYGTITCYDLTLTARESIEDFFARHRICGRGAFVDCAEGLATYRVELAATGRRRRIAVLTEADEVEPGLSVRECVALLAKELRKVKVEIAGEVAWGKIELGEVEPEEDEVEPNEEIEGVENTINYRAMPAQDPSLPLCLITDQPLAEAPGLARVMNTPLSALGWEGLSIFLTDSPVAYSPNKEKNAQLSSYDASHFLLMLGYLPTQDERENELFDLATPAEEEESSAALPWRKDGIRLLAHGLTYEWEWESLHEDEPFSWLSEQEGENEKARDFVTTQTGIASIVEQICAYVPPAKSEALRSAFSQRHPQEACARALGLPPLVVESVSGRIKPHDVLGSTIVLPQAFSERVQSQLAYEISGHGYGDPRAWKLYRSLYLEHPHAMTGVAIVQGIAGGVLAYAGARRWNRPLGKVACIGGIAMAVNAYTRVKLTGWIAHVLENEGFTPHDSGSERLSSTFARQ